MIIRRLFLLLPVLFGASVITFSLSHIFTNPVYSYIPPTRIEFTPQWQIDALVEKYGLDKPWEVQYIRYVQGLLTGDWGVSQVSGAETPVLKAIGLKFPATLELTMVAITLAIMVGVPLGIISAVKKDTKTDHTARLFALSGVSLPVFWLAMILQFLFAHTINILPLFGRVENHIRSKSPLADNIFGFLPLTGLNTVDGLLTFNLPWLISSLRSLALPAFALSWISMALISRLTRTSMLEALKQDYIILARSKGLSDRVVIYKHALRNAMIPTITIIGLSFAGLLTGAVLTETVFAWPGLGSWVVQAILTTDSASVQGFVILSGIIYVFLNLAVDILYTLIDPRITL